MNNPGRLIEVKTRPGYFQIVEICSFVRQFTDPLPDHVLENCTLKLHDQPDGDLKNLINDDRSYKGAAQCLRTKIERRNDSYRLLEQARRNRRRTKRQKGGPN